ncbi:hypothetical protein BC831DRAFT_438618 [Entophlyctis helioformis]|nr:hypothetical protein BC831DRAFT_438618 [Entophlyctis helioformis]
MAQKSKGPKRTALHEWTRWQAITAAVFLINGGLYSFIFPYSTGNIFKVPLKSITLPLSYPGVVATIAGPLILLIENDIGPFAMLDNRALKILMYLPLGIFTSLQLTLVQPGVFLIVIALLLMVDAVQSGGDEEPERMPR